MRVRMGFSLPFRRITLVAGRRTDWKELTLEEGQSDG